MKKILALVISACVLASTPAFAETKKPAPKKEVKHHKKAEGTETVSYTHLTLPTILRV